jgi:hypothetical protein
MLHGGAQRPLGLESIIVPSGDVTVGEVRAVSSSPNLLHRSMLRGLGNLRQQIVTVKQPQSWIRLLLTVAMIATLRVA